MRFRFLDETPDNFRVETTFNMNYGFYRAILGIPFLKNLFSEILIRQGKIFLRPYKVDPSKPEQYWVDGYKVRNMSQRKDGTYLTAGGVHHFKITH